MTFLDLKNLVTQIKWDPKYQGLGDHIELSYVHRGSVTGEKSIFFSQIKGMQNRFLIIEDSEGGETMIPLHRITRIYRLDRDQTLYFHPYIEKTSNLS
jgi:uncharacterized protein (UPF0248 family)